MVKVFSGIRPSGKLHLGNYLGAIKNWIELQNSAQQCIFAVVDYHGITTPYNPKTYHQQIMDAVLDYLAAGVDPNPPADGPLLIRQSKVPQHTELAWIFNTITPIGWLERLPNYKEKIKQVEESGNDNSKSYQNNLSLLAYPVLMASDILLYKSNLVPVGDDQKQHIDLANEIGSKFNHLFGEVFPNIKAHIVQGARIMSLKDPAKKMSKTHSTASTSSQQAGSGQAGDDGCIYLVDEPDTVVSKIKSATTDSGKEIKYDEKEKPGISNLLTIYSLLAEKEIKELEKDYAGKSYVDFKNDLAEITVNFLNPFQQKRKEFKKNMDQVAAILTKSEEKTTILAGSTLTEVKERMGL